jgi:hypothetical protein
VRRKEVELAIEVEIERGMEVEIEPIRVDTKLDIVETEAELGAKSRIHNLAFCALGALKTKNGDQFVLDRIANDKPLEMN